MSKNLDIWWDRLLKLIELLRPKFYNKLTWLIVIGGLGLMSKPLWLTVINVIFETSIQLSITDNADSAWGFALVVLGLIYHFFNTGLHEFVISKKESSQKQLSDTHDLEIFKSIDLMINEPYVDNLIAYMQTSDAIMREDFEKLRKFGVYASESRNQFLAENLKKSTETLINMLNSLLSFINKEFDEYPYSQAKTNFRMCLAPQLNCDRAGQWEDGPKYDVLIDQMMQKTSALNSNYKDWRSVIKKNLLV
jgi:hypothetical protein